MMAVIFEVEPHPERNQDYLDAGQVLRPLLDGIDGFISVERFESLAQPGKILSLSFWRDEKAIQDWRKAEKHREVQLAGRGGIFANYRLRVASVVRDYGMFDREQAPQKMAPVESSPTTHANQ